MNKTVMGWCAMALVAGATPVLAADGATMELQLAQQGKAEVRADRRERRGDRLDRRLDRRGDRIDRRLDRRGDRIDDRLDRRGDRIKKRMNKRTGRPRPRRGGGR